MNSKLLGLELYFGSLLGGGISLKLSHLVEVEETSKNVLRERTDDEVVVLHGGVELVASLVDAVLRAFELNLKLLEVLVGLQVGIVLLDGDELAESRTEFALSLLNSFSFSGVSVAASRVT